MDELHAIVDKINQHLCELADCKSERQMLETFNFTLAAEILMRYSKYDPIGGNLCAPIARLIGARIHVDLRLINSLLDLYNSIRTVEAMEMVRHG